MRYKIMAAAMTAFAFVLAVLVAIPDSWYHG